MGHLSKKPIYSKSYDLNTEKQFLSLRDSVVTLQKLSHRVRVLQHSGLFQSVMEHPGDR